MANEYGVDDLLDFLTHASEKGLIPAASAKALAVAARNVLGILGEDERKDMRTLDLDAVIRRFSNKRAKDFNPSSLKEYGRRVRRAVELFVTWRDDPANFSVKTRTTTNARKKEGKNRVAATDVTAEDVVPVIASNAVREGGRSYQSAVQIRPGVVVTISNIPSDLTTAEAKRLAQFVEMFGVD